MMRTPLLLLLSVVSLFAQTTAYLRSSGPGEVEITGATNATPPVITTQYAHGYSAGDTIGIWGTCSNGGASPITGIRKVASSPAPTTYTYAITDLSGTPITANGPWCDGSSSGWVAAPQWSAKVTAYTLTGAAQGWLDGPTGDKTRKLALSPLNGMTSLVVSGASCTSGGANGCTVTVTTGYDPTAAQVPLATGNYFSITGTGTKLDSTSATSCLGTGSATNLLPYTVATVSSSGWTATFTCSGLATGDYTSINTSTCGPQSTPNDTVRTSGGQSCTRVSQLAWAGNPAWDVVTGTSSAMYMDDPTNAYQYAFDAPGVGTRYPETQEYDYEQSAAVRFLVDPGNALLFRDLNYYFNRIERIAGVSFITNETQLYGGNYANFGQAGNYITMNGLGLIYLVYSPYTSSANKAL